MTRPWSGRSACVWELRPRVNFFNVDHVVRRRDACQALLLPCPVFLLASRSTLPTLRTLLTVSVPRTGVLGMETVAHRATRQPARQPACSGAMKRRVAKFAARRPAARPATSRFDRANTNGQRAITIAITIAITGFASRYFVFLWRYYACYYGFALGYYAG